MSFLRLPPELIEQILVDTAAAGEPNTVAAVAAVCRLLHDLVHSIWRDLFLATFDDPRPKIALITAAPAPPAPTNSYPLHDWFAFTARIAAANRLRAGAPTTDFSALVDVLATAAPVPPFRTLDSLLPRQLVFPPLLRFRDTSTSNNIPWLDRALAGGYPPVLARRLLAAFAPDANDSPFCRPEWEDSPQGKAFYKVVFMNGFTPNKTYSTPLKHQYATARALARTRVYNTKYLMPERCWGPFQPLDPSYPGVYDWRNRLSAYVPPESDSQDADIALRSAAGSRSYYTSHPSSIVLTPSLFDPDDDIDDPDYDPGHDSDTDDVHGDTPHLLHFLSSHGIDFADERTHPTFVFPAPHRVVPDYAFLAAARIIIEANMRENFETDVVYQHGGSTSQLAAADAGLELMDVIDAMKSLDLTRMGGAPGFWDVWRPEKPEVDEVEDEPPAPVDMGKGKATSEEVEGWDWAGVEGEWRRVVCWLDYRDLLMHNVGEPHATGFSTDDLQETIRIFPMTLRVARYSVPPHPPPGADPTALIWRLPVIHVEGETRGTDTDEASARVCEGTVRIIGDGAVRWSLTSSEAAGHDPEWVTESVQVGEIGSAVGLIGLWTGAEHSSTDPLGPCWAWKVA